MEPFHQPRRDSYSTWLTYLLVVGLIVGGLVALQFLMTDSGGTATAESSGSIRQGDFFVKEAIAGISADAATAQAEASYRKARPMPEAYRRLGVLQETMLSESGLEYFDKIDSVSATQGLSDAEVDGLKREVAMWTDIYGSLELSKAQAKEYAERIRALDLGPLGDYAIADVYKKSGEVDKSTRLIRDAKYLAKVTFYGFAVLILLLTAIGLGGVALVIYFFMVYGPELGQGGRPRIQPNVLLITFLVYLVSFVALSVAFAWIADLGGMAIEGGPGIVVELVINVFVVMGAFGLGLATLYFLTSYTGEDPSEIGFRVSSLKSAVKWGFGGFAAAVPVLAVALVITAVLAGTIFKNVRTPEQEVLTALTQGGILEYVLVFFIASILAPVVEETFFRGALYGSLRGRMGVWPAVLLSAAIFAVIHPLPGGFLLIFSIASVFAVLREKTGSLVPGMICHSLYNTVVLLVALLM